MPTLRLDGDASGAVKATSDVSSAARNLDKEFKQVGLTTDQLRDQMARAFNEKPIDTYIRRCDELAQKVAAGKMTMFQYTEQTDRLADSMRRANEVSDRLAESKYHQALDAELKKLPPITREFEKYHDEVILTGRALENTADKQDKAFGTAALTGLASYAAGMISIGAAVNFVTSALRAQAEEKARALQSDESSTKAAGRLSAVGGTAEDLAYARQLHRTGIVDTDTEGIHAVTGFRQAGLSKAEQQYAAKLADEMLVDPSQVGEYAQTVQTFRRSQGAKGGSFESAEKQIRAAGRMTRFAPEDIALQATRLATPGVEAGMSKEEQIATLIVFANKTRNLKTAGTEAEKQVTDGEKFQGADAAEYAKVLQQVQAAGGEGIGPSLVHTDLRLNSADSAADSRSAYDVQKAEGMSARAGMYQLIENRVLQQNNKRYGNGVMGALSEAALRFGATVESYAGREDSAIRHYAELTPQQATERGFSADDIAQLKRYMQEQTEIMRRQDRQPPAPSGRQE